MGGTTTTTTTTVDPCLVTPELCAGGPSTTTAVDHPLDNGNCYVTEGPGAFQNCTDEEPTKVCCLAPEREGIPNRETSCKPVDICESDGGTHPDSPSTTTSTTSTTTSSTATSTTTSSSAPSITSSTSPTTSSSTSATTTMDVCGCLFQL